jgi:hypothetical protein
MAKVSKTFSNGSPKSRMMVSIFKLIIFILLKDTEENVGSVKRQPKFIPSF